MYFLRQARLPNLSLRPRRARAVRFEVRVTFFALRRRFGALRVGVDGASAMRLAGVICANPAKPPGGMRKAISVSLAVQLLLEFQIELSLREAGAHLAESVMPKELRFA